MKYQHNYSITINKKNYEYVREYKKQLLQNITNLLNDLRIRFVISHGNLIEYKRGAPIYHDDDIDIRFNKDDYHIWYKFCKENNSNNIEIEKYNLVFDWRFPFTKTQMLCGIKCNLIQFKNTTNIEVFPNIKINCDLVCSKLSKSKIWADYNINYNNLQKIEYLEVNTYAPNDSDTQKVLSKEYGKKYLIPLYSYEIL